MRFGKVSWLAALVVASLPSPNLAQSPPQKAELSFEARQLRGMRAEVSALLLFGVSGGELAMAAMAWPELGSQKEQGSLEVRLLVDLEGLSLLESSGDQTLMSIEVHAYAVTPDGSVSGYLSQVIRVDLDDWGERLVDRGLRWSDSFELPAGEYSLKILTLDRESGRYGLRILPLVLGSTLDGQPSSDPRLSGSVAGESEEPWFRVRGANEDLPLSPLPAPVPVARAGNRIASSEPQPNTILEKSGRRRMAAVRRAAKQGYEAVLRRLSSGKRRAAIDQLVDLEAELAIGEQEVETLYRAELDFARSLAERHDEILLPLSMLHLDTYREHRRRQQFPAASHSRSMVVDLTTLWLELDEGEAAQKLAADVLVCLALELMDADLRQTAREVFRRALTWQPDHETAGLQLALSYERSALYDDAISTTRLLVNANPKLAEARLRLAVNLARAHQPAKARRIYRRLLAEHNPGWILTIAYEELARLDLAAKQADEAISLLSSGISRLPAQQSLYLLQAHLLDRQERSSEAFEVLQSMPLGAEPSPRHRYSWPPQPAIYRSLLTSANARLGYLARALEAIGDRRSKR